jgi:predicted Fe-Mo cluster-binding NifX family protein
MYGVIVMRIAVARKDTSPAIVHFGRADNFQVFDVAEDDSGIIKLFETRSTKVPCSTVDHDLDVLQKSAETIKDCGAVIASGIGPAAIDILATLHIYPYLLQSGDEKELANSIVRIRARLLKNRQIKNNFRNIYAR